MKNSWAEPDIRDEVVDYVRYWSDKTGIKATKMIRWIGIHRSKYYDWASRYGKINEHNAWIPRDFWLADWEKQAIIETVARLQSMLLGRPFRLQRNTGKNPHLRCESAVTVGLKL